VVGVSEQAALADGFRATDVGNAGRLVASAQGRIRYVRAWQKWMVYSRGQWIIDTGETLITELAKRVAKGMLARAAKLDHPEQRGEMWKHALRCEKGAAIASMIRLARGVPEVLVEHDQLDRHPHLLNVANGTINLRTGELQPHNPDDLLTMQAPVTYNGQATAPLFERCLERWQPDPQIRAYLQRAVGSGITGHPVEALFVNVGQGGNGKSKFFGTLETVLGPFHVIPHKSLLVAQRHEQHPTHVASLFGARILVSAETRNGDQLDEEMIKNLTGGDQLRARRMREDEWSFAPTHSMFLHTNHEPQIKGADEGVWRRVRLIPWNVTIPKAERDEHLSRKLAEEASGILNWLVDGAVQWYATGLDEPEAVLVATEGYRERSDVIARFIADACITGPHFTARAQELYEKWSHWCRENGEALENQKMFAKAMERHGHTKRETKRGRVYIGIGIQADDDQADDTAVGTVTTILGGRVV
jgi:putative DNA primase/helicase